MPVTGAVIGWNLLKIFNGSRFMLQSWIRLNLPLTEVFIGLNLLKMLLSCMKFNSIAILVNMNQWLLTPRTFCVLVIVQKTFILLFNKK